MAKKEKQQSWTALLERRLFVAHEGKDLDPDEELSCYSSEQEAVCDPCCEFITEILIIRTAERDAIVAELEKQGIKIKPRIIDDGKRPESKQVVALMRLADTRKVKIGALIKKHLQINVALRQLSKAQVSFILEQENGAKPTKPTEPERVVEEAAGESSIVGG